MKLHRGTWLAVVFLGCGGGKPSAAPPTNASPPTPPPVAAAPAAPADAVPVVDPGDCESDEAEDVPADLHDRIPFEDAKTGRMGYKTKAGKVALPARYEEATTFGRGGIANVRIPDAKSVNPYRWIDTSGKILATPHLFDNGPDYWQGGRSRIVDERGKFGFIGRDGVIVVPPSYDFVYPFCRGIAKTALDGKVGYIDENGKPAPAPANDDRPLIPPKKND